MIVQVSLLEALLEHLKWYFHFRTPAHTQKLVDVFCEVSGQLMEVFILLLKHDEESATTQSDDVIF